MEPAIASLQELCAPLLDRLEDYLLRLRCEQSGGVIGPP
jgi:hypothetical protein